MPRPEIIIHLIRIRRQDPGYYKWAAPRYEALDMPGLQSEIDAIWDAMAAEDRAPPWLQSGRPQHDGSSKTGGSDASP